MSEIKKQKKKETFAPIGKSQQSLGLGLRFHQRHHDFRSGFHSNDSIVPALAAKRSGQSTDIRRSEQL